VQHRFVAKCSETWPSLNESEIEIIFTENLKHINFKTVCYRNQLTPWNKVLLQKLTVVLVVRTFPVPFMVPERS
jgi:hypothetical protein